MPDELTGLDASQNAAVGAIPAAAKAADPLESLTAAELIAIIRDTRSESAERRLELKRIRDEQGKAEAARAAAEAERLAKTGEWEKLASTYKTELDALKPVQTELEQLRGVFNNMLEQRLKEVPEHFHGLLKGLNPVEALNWLTANADKVTTRTAPAMDGGMKGDAGAARLSEAELEMARRFRLTPEQMAKARQQRSG